MALFEQVFRKLSLNWRLVRVADGLEAVQYLDTFQGGNLPPDQQSVHFSMVFRHPERTLTGEEVEAAVKGIVEACETRFQARLRT